MLSLVAINYANEWVPLITLSSVAVAVLLQTLQLLFWASVTLHLLLELSDLQLIGYLRMLVISLVTTGAFNNFTVAPLGGCNLMVTFSASSNFIIAS